MARIALFAALTLSLLLPGCASPRNASEREWQMAECTRIIDEKMREKCVQRVNAEYGRR